MDHQFRNRIDGLHPNASTPWHNYTASYSRTARPFHWCRRATPKRNPHVWHRWHKPNPRKYDLAYRLGRDKKRANWAARHVIIDAKLNG